METLRNLFEGNSCFETFQKKKKKKEKKGVICEIYCSSKYVSPYWVSESNVLNFFIIDACQHPELQNVKAHILGTQYLVTFVATSCLKLSKMDNMWNG